MYRDKTRLNGGSYLGGESAVHLAALFTLFGNFSPAWHFKVIRRSWNMQCVYRISQIFQVRKYWRMGQFFVIRILKIH